MDALRHGQAKRLQLAVLAGAGSVTLELIDDGNGLAPDWSKRTGHYGLRWLNERVEALQGTARVEPAAPRGVRLRVELPLTEAMTVEHECSG